MVALSMRTSNAVVLPDFRHKVHVSTVCTSDNIQADAGCTRKNYVAHQSDYLQRSARRARHGMQLDMRLAALLLTAVGMTNALPGYCHGEFGNQVRDRTACLSPSRATSDAPAVRTVQMPRMPSLVGFPTAQSTRGVMPILAGTES